MATSSNDNAPTQDAVRKYKQKLRDHSLGLDYAALITGQPRTEEEAKIQEMINKENEQKNMIKNKWMVLTSIDQPTEYAIEAMFDTGAVLNFMTEGMVESMKLEKKLLDQPEDIITATGLAGQCKYHVYVNWRGRPGCHGEVEFFVLPETSTIPAPLIGTDAKECWDELLDEKPRGVVYYTALSKQKASERIEADKLRDKVQNEQSQLQRKKELHEERRGGSSSKSKGSRANEKKTKRN